MAGNLASTLRDELTELLSPLTIFAAAPDGMAVLLRAVGRVGSAPDDAALLAELMRLADLATAIHEIDDAALSSWEGIARVLNLAGDLIAALRGIEAVVTDPTVVSQVIGLGADLVAWLVARYLRARRPRLFRTAALLTLITPAEEIPPTPIEVVDGELQRLPWSIDRVEVARIADAIGDPCGTLPAAYFPNGLAHARDAHELAARLFPRLHALAREMGLSTSIGSISTEPAPSVPPDAEVDVDLGELGSSPLLGDEDPPPPQPPDLTEFERTHLPRFVLNLPGIAGADGAAVPARVGLVAVASSAEHPGGIRGLLVSPWIGTSWTETRGSWRLTLSADGEVPGLVIGPNGVSLAPLSSPATGTRASLVIERIAAAGAPAFRLGSAEGTRLELGALQIGFAADVGAARQAIEISARASQGVLVLAAGDGDGFLQSVLPADGLRASFDLGVILSSEDGLRLEGGAGLAVSFPTTLRLGAVSVDAIALAVIASPGEVRVEATAAIGVRIGPVDVRIAGAGLQISVSHPPDDGGNLGPINLALGFKPPDGLGLSLSTTAISGGGYIAFDRRRQQYSGVLQLNLQNTLDVQALGILHTKLPDGRPGYSLLALLGMRFPKPIHLGYNVYLSGVGGLLGLHRTADVDRMRAGLRDGSASNVLFPKDVVANAASLITDLEELFPVRRGQLVIGPTAQLTWNTPPLITAEVGLIVELGSPTRVVLLGALRAAVPKPDEALLDIKVAFLGTVDLDKGLLSFDASVYDSYIGRGAFKFAFTGDLALRASWGERKDLVATVGGFHPEYTPPAYLRLPSLRRVTISLLKDNPKLTLSTYFALTSNTVQLGAELDFLFKVSSFSIVGTFGFDALFQFSPFKFTAAVRAHLAVKKGSSTLFGLSLEFSLAGTTPWIAKGKASFRILFFTVSVHFEKTWGETRTIGEPRIAVLPLLRDELARTANWGTELSPGANRGAQLTAGAQSADAGIVDPAGVLTIRQTLVPLGTTLARFGNSKISDICRADIAAVKVGASGSRKALTLSEVRDGFAPAAFQDLTDRDKLKAASYESRKSGVGARGAAGLHTTFLLGRKVTYERIVSDGAESALPAQDAPRARFQSLVPGGAIGRSPLARRNAIANQAATAVNAGAPEERFAIVHVDTMRAPDAASQSMTRADAEARLRQLGPNYDIVPAYARAA